MCCCDGCSSEESTLQRIRTLVEQYKDKEGSLINVLHAVQGIYGYLPLHVQKLIAEVLDKPLSEVSGVVSFYSFFSTEPQGKHIIKMCLGTACYVCNGSTILEEIEKILGTKAGHTTPSSLFSIEIARCIGACGMAPVMMIDDTVYGNLTPDKISAILETYMNESGEKQA